MPKATVDCCCQHKPNREEEERKERKISGAEPPKLASNCKKEH